MLTEDSFYFKIFIKHIISLTNTIEHVLVDVFILVMTFSSKIHHIKYKKNSPSGQKKLNIQTQTKQNLALQHILPKNV